MNANLYDLFQSRFPENRASCCIETGCGRQYSWDEMEPAPASPIC
jgi:malonyl-CoA/methylmalonyl-CoA synthetase